MKIIIKNYIHNRNIGKHLLKKINSNIYVKKKKNRHNRSNMGQTRTCTVSYFILILRKNHKK